LYQPSLWRLKWESLRDPERVVLDADSNKLIAELRLEQGFKVGFAEKPSKLMLEGGTNITSFEWKDGLWVVELIPYQFSGGEAYAYYNVEVRIAQGTWSIEGIIYELGFIKGRLIVVAPRDYEFAKLKVNWHCLGHRNRRSYL